MSARRGLRVAVVLVAALLLPLAGSWLSGALFLLANRANPLQARPASLVNYWAWYAGDARLLGRLRVATAAGFGATCVALPLALVLGRRDTRPLHGAARFASAREVRACPLFAPARRAIVLGRHHGRFLLYAGAGFAALAAPTRSGKGVAIVIPNLLQWPDSVVVTDIKRENYDLTAGWRAAHGQAVYVWAPFSTHTHAFNPLDAVRRGTPHAVTDVLAIAAVLYPATLRGDAASFFNDQARNLFSGLVLLLLETPGARCSLGELVRVASGLHGALVEHLARTLDARRAGGDPLSPQCEAMLGRYLHNVEKTRGDILATMLAPLTVFTSPVVDAATARSDFDLADLRRRRMSVYLVIGPDQLQAGTLLLTLFATLLVSRSTQALPAQDPTLRHEVLCLWDEFAALGRLTALEKGVAFLAGYGLRFLTIFQSPSQLVDLYGEAGARTYLSNQEVRVLYRPQELADARELSELLGTQTVESRTRSRSRASRDGAATAGESTSPQRRPLLLAQELMELPAHAAIVRVPGLKPVLVDKIRYHDDPVFTARLRPPPALPECPPVEAAVPERLQTLAATSAAHGGETGTAATADAPAGPADPVPPLPRFDDADTGTVLDAKILDAFNAFGVEGAAGGRVTPADLASVEALPSDAGAAAENLLRVLDALGPSSSGEAPAPAQLDLGLLGRE